MSAVRDCWPPPGRERRAVKHRLRAVDDPRMTHKRPSSFNVRDDRTGIFFSRPLARARLPFHHRITFRRNPHGFSAGIDPHGSTATATTHLVIRGADQIAEGNGDQLHRQQLGGHWFSNTEKSFHLGPPTTAVAAGGHGYRYPTTSRRQNGRTVLRSPVRRWTNTKIPVFDAAK